MIVTVLCMITAVKSYQWWASFSKADDVISSQVKCHHFSLFFIFFFNLRTSYKCIFKSHPLRYMLCLHMNVSGNDFDSKDFKFFNSVFMLRATGTIYQMIWGRTMKHFLTLAFDYIVLSLKFNLVNDPLRCCCCWNFFDKSNDFFLFHCTFALVSISLTSF